MTQPRPNAVLYDWGTIVGRLLTGGGNAYRIGGMYLEFQNVGDASDPVTPPTFDRTGGVDYYNNLSSSPDIDYLRIPLVASTLTSSDDELFPGGNLMTFFAQSQASVGTGVHGKTFNDAAISKVFGAALVAVPVLGDRSRKQR